MSGSGDPPAAPSLRRLLGFGTLALLGPPAIGLAIAFSEPDREVRLEGIGALAGVCVVLVAIATAIATAARVGPLAIGTLTGVAFAIGSVVRDGSVLGAAIVLGAGFLGGAIAAGQKKHGPAAPRGRAALMALTIVLGVPIGLLARVGPEQASRAASDRPVLASATSAGGFAVGYVLRAEPRRYLQGADLIRVVPRGIGSWVVGGHLQLLEACDVPSFIQGFEFPGLIPFAQPPVNSGVLVSRTDTERVCYVASERVIAGIAPPGTARIEAVTIAGEEVDVPIGEGRAYLVMLEDGTDSANYVRLSFRDARGALLDSKPATSAGEYANFAFASGLIERPADPGSGPQHLVTVSRYILTPAEFLQLCGEKPPHGEGFVGIAIVRRDDGETREVVIGTGMPLSSGHPRPDPPLVRESGSLPCFAR